jgi:hypothetical protein
LQGLIELLLLLLLLDWYLRILHLTWRIVTQLWWKL